MQGSTKAKDLARNLAGLYKGISDNKQMLNLKLF